MSTAVFWHVQSPHGGHAQSVWHSKRECSEQIVEHGATLLPSRSATVRAREDCDLTLVLLLLSISTGWAVLWLLTAAVRWGLYGGNR